MDLRAPISTIMTTDLITVSSFDPLSVVKKIFDDNRIHHLPVIRAKKLIGIISKADLLFFMRSWNNKNYQEIFEGVRFSHYTAENLMTTSIAKLNPNENILAAVKVFEENLFHAIPIVNEEDELKGLVTTYDLIKALAKEDREKMEALRASV